MTDHKLRAADLVARRLYEAGCRYAFGIPGGEVLTLVDALEAAGITFILAKHENAAGFMAEGVWQRTGAPGILVATVGPGVVNGVNVVANAEQDRVPFIVLTGCVDETAALTYTHQVLDHQQVLRPVTKASFRLTAEGADVIADKALAIATDPRAGPVHIDVPIAVAEQAVAPARLRRRPPAAPAAPAPGHELDRARLWLEDAKRPVMIVGLDALADDAGEEILAFCEIFSIPFVTTYKAKGIVSEEHPLCLGAAGLSPKADALLLPFVSQADLILCLGYDPIEMRAGWCEPWDPEAVHVIDIAAEPNRHYVHQAGINFVTHCGKALEALGHGAAPQATWELGEVEVLKGALAEAFPRDEAWGPAAVIDTCRRVLPKETVATCDTGAHRILLAQMWETYEPKTLLQSTGLCTMGCALPLAIGAQLAEPERPVIAFTGDAGLLMVAGELSTAAELASRVVVVVFVDSSLALIELKQRQRQMANAGVDFGSHDFAAIGRAFGGLGHTVTSRAELEEALDDALNAETFTVIAAMIGRQGYDGRF
ncbi:thiamine pyrophosphate-binding protein [Pelagibius sp. CAU 1746]|uniref:thiamine pyrophosphate-binding protein n=1 Tax=Pelagibius sp. CAU 1746 TaxID=3140370 RepID=UPI00325B40E7